MPLEHSKTKAALGRNMRVLMGEIGKSPHVQSRKQAIAIALSTQRRAKAEGGEVDELRQRGIANLKRHMAGRHGRDVQNVQALQSMMVDEMVPRRDGRDSPHGPGGWNIATGGGVGVKTPNVSAQPWYQRQAGYGLTRGMLHSNVPGRTDRLGVSVKPGSYVIPADTVSALGQNNSAAGASVLGKMFSGARMNRYGAGRARMPSLPGMKRGMFAEGGSADEVPINAAGGEYVLTPEEVAEVGSGNLDHGHRVLDQFVLNVRKNHIKTLRNLKPPKKD